MAVGTDQKIFWFQVSVSNLLLMKVLKCKCYFSDIKECHVIGEDVLFTKQSEDLTSLDKIKYQVKVQFVLESLY